MGLYFSKTFYGLKGRLALFWGEDLHWVIREFEIWWADKRGKKLILHSKDNPLPFQVEGRAYKIPKRAGSYNYVAIYEVKFNSSWNIWKKKIFNSSVVLTTKNFSTFQTLYNSDNFVNAFKKL